MRRSGGKRRRRLPRLDTPEQSRLFAVVEEAYPVFGRRPTPPHVLDVCLHCCVSDEVEQRLRLLPLKQVPAKYLYEYNGSAMSEIQNAREVGYFLPRMLELLAIGDEIHHSIEISLDRLGRCPKDSWTEAETAVLDRFAKAYFDVVLRTGPLGGDRHRILVDDPLSVLLMFDIAGLDIGPLLELWLNCEHPYATVQYVENTYWDFWEDGDYKNAFASDRPEFRRRIREWLTAPEHRRRFAEKMISPEFLAAAETHTASGNMPFSMVVEGVFAQLVQ